MENAEHPVHWYGFYRQLNITTLTHIKLLFANLNLNDQLKLIYLASVV